MRKNCKMLMNNQNGVSLVELLVVTFIFTLVSAGLYSISAVGQDSWATNTVKVELQQEVRKAMEAMINDLRQSGNSAIVDVPVNTTGDTTTTYTKITFKKANTVSGGVIQWDASNTIFRLCGTNSNQLWRLSGSQTCASTGSVDPKNLLAHNIQSVTFQRLNGATNKVNVSIQAQDDTVKGDTLTHSLNFSVQVRN